MMVDFLSKIMLVGFLGTASAYAQTPAPVPIPSAPMQPSEIPVAPVPVPLPLPGPIPVAPAPIAPTLPPSPFPAPPKTEPPTAVRTTAKTLEHPYGESEERRVRPEQFTDFFPSGAFVGTLVREDVGQETVVGVKTPHDFKLMLNHLRLPDDPDLLRGGVITPEVYGFSFLGAGETATDQENKRVQGQVRYRVARNALVRSGFLQYDKEKHIMVGGETLGLGLGGFFVSGDVIAAPDDLERVLVAGFTGFRNRSVYLSAGGTSAGLVASSQGYLPGNRRWGSFNQVWYRSEGERGFQLLLGPELSLDSEDALGLDERLVDAGQLWALRDWRRLVGNYANGRVLFEFNGRQNEEEDTSFLGGMVYTQRDDDNGPVENYLLGVGLGRARDGSCKEWDVSVLIAVPFPWASAFVTTRFDVEDYSGEYLLGIGSVNRNFPPKD